MKTGHTPSRSNDEFWVDCTIPWFTLADVWQLRDGTRKFLGETANQISELGLANSAAELLPAGTVVLSRTASVGFSGIMPKPMATSQDFWNWVCGPGLMPEYLLYQLRAMTQEFQLMIQGSTHKTIYQAVAATLSCAVPPVDEQRAIADYLNRETAQIDELIAEQDALVSSLIERRELAITWAVTQGSSGISPLKVLASVTDCKHITADFVHEGFPVASIGQVGEHVINLETAPRTTPEFFAQLREGGRAPRAGDLVMTRNANVGAVALVPNDVEPFALGQDVCLISPGSGTSSEYLYFALKSQHVADQVASMGIGSTFKRINVETIRQIGIPVHSSDQQSRIAGELDRELRRLDELISPCRELVALLKERRSALITAAVTGRIDVRGS